MSEKGLNLADATTITGGVITCIGAFNLDKPWGAVAATVGKSFDLVDGFLARLLCSDGEDGAHLDSTVDRVTESVIVASLVTQDIIPTYLPIFGYGIKLASKTKGDDYSLAGHIAMTLKDIAVGAGVASTHFDKETKRHKYLKTSAQALGWCAVGLGVYELFN